MRSCSAHFAIWHATRSKLGSSPTRWTGTGAALAPAHAGLERPRVPLAENDLRAAFGAHNNWRPEYLGYVRTKDEDCLSEAA
jgi:hypothetical protein